MEDRDVSDVVYLYGFVPADAPAPPPEVGGIAGAPVHLIDVDGMRAAVAHLPQSEYSAERIEPRLQDLAWVGEQGMAHERVVVWFADNAEILPARMFSIYSGEDALRSAIRNEVAGLADKLRALTGKREWNLKVAYDAEVLARHGREISDDVRRLDAEIDVAPPGRRYLLQRRRSDLLRDELSRAARRMSDEMLERLRPHAADIRVLPITAGEDTGSVVLHAALLVPRAAEPALRDDAAELYARFTALGMIVSFSGPWAAYRFVEQSDEA